MKRTLKGACILVLTLAAYQGVSTFIEHTHLREFNHATTIAKVTRFGASRRTRLDVWFEQRHGQVTMKWSRMPRSWFSDAVPVRLDVTSGKKQLRYHFSVHLQKREMRPLDQQTRALETNIRTWAMSVK